MPPYHLQVEDDKHLHLYFYNFLPQSCQKRISYYMNISLVLYFVYEEDSHKSTKHILPVNHCILLKSKVKNLPKKHIHILLFQIAAFF